MLLHKYNDDKKITLPLKHYLWVKSQGGDKQNTSQNMSLSWIVEKK